MSIVADIKDTFRGRNNGLMKLILINVIVFIVANLFLGLSKLSGYNGHLVYEVLGLNPIFMEFIFRPWTLLSYMFLQLEVMHIFYNMLWLFWMGKIFVEYIGSRQLISTYIMGGISGG